MQYITHHQNSTVHFQLEEGDHEGLEGALSFHLASKQLTEEV